MTITPVDFHSPSTSRRPTTEVGKKPNTGLSKDIAMLIYVHMYVTEREKNTLWEISFAVRFHGCSYFYSRIYSHVTDTQCKYVHLRIIHKSYGTRLVYNTYVRYTEPACKLSTFCGASKSEKKHRTEFSEFTR